MIVRSVVLIAALVTVGGSTALAQESEGGGVAGLGLAGEVDLSAAPEDVEEEESAPWRGSEFIWRNVMSAISLDPSHDLTWNPYYAMSFTFRAKWWFDDIFNVGARLDVTREITQADDTTFIDEALLDDLVVSAGASKFYTIPVAGIDFSADLLLTTPTSKISQARTLVLGIGPGVSVGRTFDAIGPLRLSYHVRTTGLLHRYTTAARETPLIPGCDATEGGCDSFLNTGLRKVRFRVAHGVDVSWDPLEWLGVSAGFEHIIDWLHPIDGSDPRVTFETEPNTNERQRSAFSVELTFTPIPSWQIGVGYETVSPQLKLDSTYENPFYNRYSTVYLDLRLEFDGLVDQLAGG
ncbi:MAG: hypothetical protein HY905_05850 [Deltaproteobacteria bacterium]|nr:hypothetical protein [Deltaproteobacteria bacterium]